MPTASDRALAEASAWSVLAGHWTAQAAPVLWENRPPLESHLVVFHDPAEDLRRRSRQWGHDLPDHALPSLADFAAGLAKAEAEAWATGAAQVAASAYSSRRLLLGDRMIHWAVPWLSAVSLRHQAHEGNALGDLDFLLELGDDMRVAPLLPGSEGLVARGADSFGPTKGYESDPLWQDSLWSGAVVLDQTSDLAAYYEDCGRRWKALAVANAGSAQLWADLALRATTTASSLREDS